MITAYKKVGETPLECLERVRIEQSISEDVPMTYAGRLDPLAEGKLLILVGDECKDKETYLNLDKEYEVGIVFGISTDSYDALGLATLYSDKPGFVESPEARSLNLDLLKYVDTFTQPYPAFSSKTFNGKQLHELARRNELPEEMPEREVEIYSVELLGKSTISGSELKARILKNIELVKGDFRQEEIKKRWEEVLGKPDQPFDILNIKVKCSSGTYMRSLADRMGKDLGTGAFAISIKRTFIADPSL